LFGSVCYNRIRMSDNQIEEVKTKTDIVIIIGERIELKKAGRNFKAPCPFHGEKTPSFMVSPELQIFKCFGCSEAGDVFSFLDKYEGMEFGEALKYLAERAGVKLERTGFGESSDKEKLIEINNQVVRFYNYLLLEHPVGAKALEYLEKQRGIKKETIKEFQLGYSPESSYALTKFLVGKKKFAPTDIEKAGIGIVRGSNMYDRFNGRVIFPLFDHRGNPIGFAGRVLPWDKRETGKYINSPETPIYHKSNVLFGLNLTRSFIKKKKVAIVVEGELDLISSWQAGIKNVVAIKGSALTEEQVRLLSRFAQKFILALDSDMAGDAAARRGIKVASDIGVEVKVAKITGYKDPDDAARGNIESYKNDLVHAEGIYDYFIDSVFSRNNTGSGAGKSKISKEIIPILAEIGDKIVQSHFANVIARKLEVPLDAVMEELAKISNKAPVTQDDPSPFKDIKGQLRREILEENYLALAFQTDPKILLSKSKAGLITMPLNKRLVEEYAKFDSGKAFNVTKFGSSLPAELFQGFSKMVLSDNQNLLENPDELNRELDLIEKELKIHTVKEKLKLLAREMREMEEKGEADKLRKIQDEFNKLAKSLSGYEEEDGGGVILREG
jgi:DNA primase